MKPTHPVTACFLACFICFTGILVAQEGGQPLPTPGQQFDLMRELAGAEKYEAAKKIGYSLHEAYPKDHDIALYLARIHGWQGEFDSAHAMVNLVLADDPLHQEAHAVRVDLAYWENDWANMAVYAQEALRVMPDSAVYREKLALARYNLSTGQDRPEVFVSYLYDHFSRPYTRNWHMISAGARIPFRAGTLIPHVNGGFLAGADPPADYQLNLDAYLLLGRLNYLLAGYGISPGQGAMYLPNHRAALELWQVLPAGFGLSAGARYFYWDRHFTFLTFSGEKYAGNWWFSLRNYLFFKDYGVSGSYYATARRYFSDRYNYLTATLGYGTAPDEPLLVASDLDRLSAVSFRLGFSRQIRFNLRLEASAGYAYEEHADREYRHRVQMNAGLFIRLGE